MLTGAAIHIFRLTYPSKEVPSYDADYASNFAMLTHGCT
jgi:hypothetical protein